MATTGLPRPFSVQTTVTANNQVTRGSQVIDGSVRVRNNNGLASKYYTAQSMNGVAALAANADTVLTSTTPSGSLFRTLHIGATTDTLALPLISTVGVGYNVSLIWTLETNAAGTFVITTNAADFFSANSVCVTSGITDNDADFVSDIAGTDQTLTITPAGAGGNQGWGRGSFIEFTAVTANSWMVRGQGAARGTGDGGTCVFSA